MESELGVAGRDAARLLAPLPPSRGGYTVIPQYTSQPEVNNYASIG
jgi:hypothetical protein